MENKHTIGDLYQMQSLPLHAKIRMTMARIEGWVDEFGEDGVYISFSGGKDSTVLMDIIRNKMRLDIPAVFVDVPTQYPELKEFAKTWDDVEIIRPNLSFMEVCEKYGFPLISKEISHKMSDWYSAHKNGRESYVDRQFEKRFVSKNGKTNMIDISHYAYLKEAPFRISHQCCNYLKKDPVHKYTKRTGRKPITAQMAQESQLRTQNWLKEGCNAFNNKNPISNPMSFWTEQDILRYIKTENLPICSVYGDVVIDYDKMGENEGQSFLFETGEEPLKTTGQKRTGCMLCGFGCHIKDDTRFLQLKELHPKMYNLLDVVKNNGVTFREAIEWTNEHGNLNIKL